MNYLYEIIIISSFRIFSVHDVMLMLNPEKASADDGAQKQRIYSGKKRDWFAAIGGLGALLKLKLLAPNYK